MFVNLTPHRINIHGTNGTLTVEPSGKSLRVSSESKLVRVDQGVEFYSVEYGSIETIDNSTKSVVRDGMDCDLGGSLPPVVEGTVYIVSGQALEALKTSGRSDFASPGELVRDANGRPVGCKGLRVI